MSCSLFRSWQEKMLGKSFAHNPSSLDETNFAFSAAPGEFPDHIKFLKQVAPKVRKLVDPKTYRIFNLIYVKGLTDEQAAKKLKYKSSEKLKSAGYKTLSIHKKKIYEVIKQILAEEDYQFV